MGFSHFFILSSRGDVIISRDCEAGFLFLSSSSLVSPFQTVVMPSRPQRRSSFATSKRWGTTFLARFLEERTCLTEEEQDKQGGAPFFVVDGISYIQHRTRGLYFVLTTQFNESPAFASSLLSRISQVIKVRFCGGVVVFVWLTLGGGRTTAASIAKRRFERTLCSSTSCWTR